MHHHHIDELVTNPQRHFTNPVEVLQSRKLNNKEKRRILESWRLDASRLAESTAENMSGGEESDLRAVSKSLLELKAMEETPNVVTGPTAAPRIGLPLALGVGAVLGAAAGLVLIAAYPAVGVIAVMAETTSIGALTGGIVAAIGAATRNRS